MAKRNGTPPPPEETPGEAMVRAHPSAFVTRLDILRMGRERGQALNIRTLRRQLSDAGIEGTLVGDTYHYNKDQVEELIMSEEGDMGTAEAASRGLLVQAYKHIEFFQKQNAELTKMILDGRALDMTRLAELEKDRREHADQYEKAIGKSHERELESMRAMRAEARLDELVVELRKYGPHIISGAVGYLKGDRASGLGPLLLTLAENLGDEHKGELAALIMKLPDEGKKAGMRILDQLQKAVAEKNQKKNGKHANGNGAKADPPPSAALDPVEPELESPELDAMLAASEISDEDLEKLSPQAREMMTKARDAARAIKAEKPS